MSILDIALAVGLPLGGSFALFVTFRRKAKRRREASYIQVPRKRRKGDLA